ncbi:UDP-N-acetylmuramoylalanyl-D-glutamate--2,6-diaminopimelate ligase, partial [Nostoc linckia z16]
MVVILRDLLYKVAIEAVNGPTDVAITGVEFDSRKIRKGDVFAAIRGTQSDGHEFIAKAIAQGAAVVVCEELPADVLTAVTYVQVQSASAALAYMAANLYGNPSRSLKLTGVTGTNGKTTIASLLYMLFRNAGYKAGLLSTVKVMVNDREYPATHTTPDSLTINKYLREMVDEGVDFCFMEVSSHGIHQN